MGYKPHQVIERSVNISKTISVLFIWATLMKRTEIIIETLAQKPFNHLTRLLG
jgi:hypothetical protein